jgi:hypothetical protein
MRQTFRALNGDDFFTQEARDASNVESKECMMGWLPVLAEAAIKAEKARILYENALADVDGALANIAVLDPHGNVCSSL